MSEQVSSEPTIDAHVHVWGIDSEQFPWQADFGVTAADPRPSELLVDSLDEAGVERALVVQSSLYGFDHSYLRRTLSSAPGRFRGVALVDPLDPATPALMKELAGQGVTGVRMIPLRVDRGWFTSRAAEIWEAAAKLRLAITFLAGPLQAKDIATWAAKYPEVLVVVDHMGRPDLVRTDPAATFDYVLALAEYENCHLKVSGLGGMSAVQFPYEDTWSWVNDAINAFGARRLMWGSDFPYVLSYRSSIAKSRESTSQALSSLREPDRALVMGGNACRVFRFGTAGTGRAASETL